MACIAGDNISVVFMRHDSVNPKSLSVCSRQGFLYVSNLLTVQVVTNSHALTLKSLRFALIVYLCASYDFRDKERLFRQTALSHSMRVSCW